MFFYLNSEVLHLEGQNASFVYNLATGEKMQLDSWQSKVLNQLQSGASIGQLGRLYSEDIEGFVQQLISNELGQLYNEQVYVPKIKTHDDKLLKSDILRPFQLNRAVIELTGECNLNCQFCTPENIIYRSCGCKKWPTVHEMLSLKDWEDVVQNIIKLKVKQVIFSGGEPFLRWDVLKRLIDLLFSHQVKCTIITNGTLIDDESGKFLKNHQVDLILQVFEHSSEGYFRVTRQAGSFNFLCNSLGIIEKYGIQHYISIVISSLNQDHLKDIQALFANKQTSLMYVYPANEYYPDKMLSQILSPVNREIPINIQNYQLHENYHNCLHGQIFISADGSLYPCMMMRHNEDSLGNIRKEPLFKVFNEQRHKKYWTTPKKNMQGCDKCARNLFCFDCRALDYYATGTYEGMMYCSEIEQGQEKTHVEKSKVGLELQQTFPE
jgi:radical SAM protein with 4Fe4S-binding SPASM domain